MNRSLTELKICLYIALPLLCVLRTAERVEALVVAPMSAQQEMFGRILAYPWAMERAEIWGNIDADFFYEWTFAFSGVPAPLKTCTPDVPRPDKADMPGCSGGADPVWLRAEWGKGRLILSRAIVTSHRD